MKKLTITTLGLMCVLGSYAAPISPEQALSRLKTNGPAKAASISKGDLQLAYTAKMEDGVASAYVFKTAAGKGFTILSADDKAIPVLGYSETGSFDADNIPPALAWWLDEQARYIKYAEENGYRGEGKAYAPEGLTAIAPLLKTTWDQEVPYNNQTPQTTYDGKRINFPTGCVATAMAQVMNYFQYPEIGQGSITYTDSGTRRTMTFNKQFDWANMLDSYSGEYNDAQVAAVSYLMKACGFSVEMNYNLNGSGALAFKVASSAVDYFKYDVGTYYTQRVFHTADEWTRLIYDNLKNVGPIVYDGQAMTGGHCFVCDGYDGNGYFHFNWGWSGLSDGYFALDALSPTSQGVGGASGGFNFSQGVVLGMQPPVAGSHAPYGNVTMFGTATASLQNGNRILFGATDSDQSGWGNASSYTVSCYVGAEFSKVDGSGTPVIVTGEMINKDGVSIPSISGNYALPPYMLFMTANANPAVTIPTLPDGDYKVTLMAKDFVQTDAPWQPFVTENGNNNFCYLTIANGQPTVKTAAANQLTVVSCEFTSPLYYGRNARMAVTVRNDSEEQLSICYYPELFRGKILAYAGEYNIITADPGETVTQTIVTPFYAFQSAGDPGPGEYTIYLRNANNSTVIGNYGNVTMSQTSFAIKISTQNFSVADTKQGSVTSGSRTFRDAYLVVDKENIDINFDFTVTSGYMDSQLRIMGAKYNPVTAKFEPFLNDVYMEYPFLGTGEKGQLSVPYSCSNLESGYVYRFSSVYNNGGELETLATMYVSFTSSGIEGIGDESSDIAPEYYNLQGVKISNPQKGQLLIRKTGNKTEKIIF